jgi:probable F420-dependent oxidoreductase
LALLLSATDRITLATGIANIWARDAVTTACAANALTEAFPERVVVGLGVSHPNLVDDLRGHQYEKPLTAMRTYLDGIGRAPYTASRPTTPVRYVLAALRRRMLSLAAERTEGAHTFFVTPQHTARARQILGRGPLLCPTQAVVLETDPDRARAIGRAYLSRYLFQPNYVKNLKELGFSDNDLASPGGNALVDALVAWGPEETIVERIREHLDAGADQVAVHVLPPKKREVPTQQWQRLAAPLMTLNSRKASRALRRASGVKPRALIVGRGGSDGEF